MTAPLSPSDLAAASAGAAPVAGYAPTRCECTCHGRNDHCEWCCNNNRDGYCRDCMVGYS